MPAGADPGSQSTRNQLPTTANAQGRRNQLYKKLTAVQEGRVRNWVEEQFIHLDAEWIKRQKPGARLTTLSAYVDMIMPVHSVILQIPPTPSSTSIRFQFFLRLTIDIFDRSTMYHHSPDVARSPSDEQHEELLKLVDCFCLFDEGWVAILSSQYWDIDKKKPLEYEPGTQKNNSRTGLSETEKSMLQSTLINGKAAVDDG
ncbi:uncharacterized protein EI90DRAFT_4715 [Cantharellus anzutake]|uniref:uncharacterized protein n=1 Tax=Cantharellus anzutake TaxID=1750568 RepID=UPI001902DC33|nr:uncharacterized protein EI90DRAFT_4715 [Cantharellus anzutake]KAF8343792.1 hypothetical protein EI90DRAFT_4715 [Cantharellus anzutake]